MSTLSYAYYSFDEQPGLVAQALIPATWKSDVGESQVKASLGNLMRPCLNIKSKRGLGSTSVLEDLPSTCKSLGSILRNATNPAKCWEALHCDVPAWVTCHFTV